MFFMILMKSVMFLMFFMILMKSVMFLMFFMILMKSEMLVCTGIFIIFNCWDVELNSRSYEIIKSV